MDDFEEHITRKCQACGGTGIQYSQVRGLRVKCPVCFGSGKD